jgi:hypothetical protein
MNDIKSVYLVTTDYRTLADRSNYVISNYECVAGIYLSETEAAAIAEKMTTNYVLNYRVINVPIGQLSNWNLLRS